MLHFSVNFEIAAVIGLVLTFITYVYMLYLECVSVCAYEGSFLCTLRIHIGQIGNSSPWSVSPASGVSFLASWDATEQGLVSESLSDTWKRLDWWNGLMTWLFGIRFILDNLFRTRNIYEISSVIIGNLIFWIPSLLNDWHGCCTTMQWRSCCKTNRASPLNAFLEDIQQNNKKVKIKWDKRRKYARWLVHFMDHIFGSDQKYKSWWCIKILRSKGTWKC